MAVGDATSAPTVVSGTTQLPAGSSSTDTSTTPGIADNFQTFLTLLTTQLQNQNPLDPLDTNQFTQQLVQFAGVEQQLKSNDQLKSMLDLQKSSASTEALVYVGQNVAVDGATAQYDTSATWNLTAAKDTSNSTVSIANAAGNVVYTGNFALKSGGATFVWDGKGNDGTQYPPGAYTISASGKDQNGQTVAISTEVQGVVDSVDLTSSPPLLSIGGANYTTDKIKRVVRQTTATTPTTPTTPTTTT
jgi:flagellar basal-body rod modification protein FlgD